MCMCVYSIYPYRHIGGCRVVSVGTVDSSHTHSARRHSTCAPGKPTHTLTHARATLNCIAKHDHISAIHRHTHTNSETATRQSRDAFTYRVAPIESAHALAQQLALARPWIVTRRWLGSCCVWHTAISALTHTHTHARARASTNHTFYRAHGLDAITT